MNEYLVPAHRTQVELAIKKSRFVAVIDRVESVSAARTFIDEMRQCFPDASHHVYSFCVGYGNTITEGMSDDGEPSGTAGPPSLSVLRGSGLGDTAIVVVRYFGGTKLGTGGLVRAYSEATRAVIDAASIVQKIDTSRLQATVPYHLYESVVRIAESHGAMILEAEFLATVKIVLEISVNSADKFSEEITENTAGQVHFCEHIQGR